MTRKNSTPNQPSLIKREVPKMPEGYYSSGPNPNLAKFVEEHSTPYDPAADDYDVAPFDKPITTTKATAIYNMHTYWSKKPHDAIQQYIRHYTKPGDLVLDPFCGSGGTALAALMEGRKAIAIDLSPAATFITKNYCTPVDVDELQRAFEELKEKVKPEMDWLYETRCDRCGGKATIDFTVYSHVFQCPRCLEMVALFDCPQVKSSTKSGKEKNIRVCPYCQINGIEEEISNRSRSVGIVPVLVSLVCEEGCKPKRSERKHTDLNPKKYDYFKNIDLVKIDEIDKHDIPYWYPKIDMLRGQETTRNASIAGRDWYYVSDLFTKRNLWALALLRSKIVSLDIFSPIGTSMMIAFTGFLLALTKMQRYYPNSSFPNMTLPGTYYTPPIFSEENVFKYWENKFLRNLKGLREISLKVNGSNILISTQTATHLPEIKSDSVDFIFTDPPYSGKYQYGELNFVWEAWLGVNSDWHEGEIIVNSHRGKTMSDWAEMIKVAMKECYRVLKPGRWISLCYHDTSEGTWQLVQDIMAEIGFIPDLSDKTLFIDAEQKSFNQINANKVTKRDLVVNFRKPRPGELSQLMLFTGEEDEKTFSEKARAILAESLDRIPGQSADTLYDELVSRMVRKGEFERHNFDEILRQVAEPVRETRMKNLFDPQDPDLFGTHESVRWYLRETAATMDEAETRKEETAAQRLESFMSSYLKAHKDEVGVHYSDLFEQYLPVSDKPRRLLQDWLIEYFYKTEDGTWRPPKDDEERQQKAALRTSGTLRTIRRFVNALNQGVPPSERDQPRSAADLAEWIYQCRRAGLYEMGKSLYEKGGLRFDALSEELQLQVEEDYQICARRGAETQKPPRSRRTKTDQEGLF